MPGSCFAEKLGAFITLSASEKQCLGSLEERERTVRRGAILVHENDSGSELFILKHGMMMSYILLADGSRQILRLLFPGDLLGAATLVYPESPETIAAVADTTVCPFERSAMSALMIGHPRLAALILVYKLIERTALTDRLAALGRTDAKGRVAGLLMEMRSRRGGDDDRVPLALTQEEIGDATGLTAVHVNRMLRQLEAEKLIARDSGHFTILDDRALAQTANYTDRYKGLDLGWLPPPR